MISEADRSAIQDLLSRYCHSIDAHRADLPTRATARPCRARSRAGWRHFNKSTGP